MNYNVWRATLVISTVLIVSTMPALAAKTSSEPPSLRARCQNLLQNFGRYFGASDKGPSLNIDEFKWQGQKPTIAQWNYNNKNLQLALKDIDRGSELTIVNSIEQIWPKYEKPFWDKELKQMVAKSSPAEATVSTASEPLTNPHAVGQLIVTTMRRVPEGQIITTVPSKLFYGDKTNLVLSEQSVLEFSLAATELNKQPKQIVAPQSVEIIFAHPSPTILIKNEKSVGIAQSGLTQAEIDFAARISSLIGPFITVNVKAVTPAGITYFKRFGKDADLDPDLY